MRNIFFLYMFGKIKASKNINLSLTREYYLYFLFNMKIKKKYLKKSLKLLFKILKEKKILFDFKNIVSYEYLKKN